MKQLFVITWGLSSSLFAGSISHEEITIMIEKIKEERKGIALKTLEGTKNPFIIKVKNSKNLAGVKEKKHLIQPLKIVEDYRLTAILNHAAFINKKWYKRGAKLGEYRVTYIGRYIVILDNEGNKKTLTLPSKKKNFIKLKKGYN